MTQRRQSYFWEEPLVHLVQDTVTTRRYYISLLKIIREQNSKQRATMKNSIVSNAIRPSPVGISSGGRGGRRGSTRGGGSNANRFYAPKMMIYPSLTLQNMKMWTWRARTSTTSSTMTNPLRAHPIMQINRSFMHQ
jgi:hypothetical protein